MTGCSLPSQLSVGQGIDVIHSDQLINDQAWPHTRRVALHQSPNSPAFGTGIAYVQITGATFLAVLGI